jgi:hypothetical protein
MAYDFAVGSRIVGNRPFLALLPSVWGCFFLVVMFITYSAIVNLPENVYHTFTVIFPAFIPVYAGKIAHRYRKY